MKLKIAIICFLFVTGLNGCVGIGIVATSNPDVKLSDAESLYMDQDRPLPAERLISEAIEIYKSQNNNHGLGNAYHDYGALLISPTLTKWGKPGMYFHDKNVSYENRKEKASDYFKLAIDYYQKAEPQYINSKEYDRLTNLYYEIAWTYNGLTYNGFDNHENSCIYFNKSLDAYSENILLNPTAKPLSPGFNSFPEMVDHYKKAIGLDCKH